MINNEIDIVVFHLKMWSILLIFFIAASHFCRVTTIENKQFSEKKLCQRRFLFVIQTCSWKYPRPFQDRGFIGSRPMFEADYLVGVRTRILSLSLLLGIWKPGDTGGGERGNSTPPSKSLVWCPNMKNITSLESSYALLLESAKNLQIFNKKNLATSSSIVKCLQKKIVL